MLLNITSAIAQKKLPCMIKKSEKLPDNLIDTRLIFFGLTFVVKLSIYLNSLQKSLKLH